MQRCKSLEQSVICKRSSWLSRYTHTLFASDLLRRNVSNTERDASLCTTMQMEVKKKVGQDTILETAAFHDASYISRRLSSHFCIVQISSKLLSSDISVPRDSTSRPSPPSRPILSSSRKLLRIRKQPTEMYSKWFYMKESKEMSDSLREQLHAQNLQQSGSES